MAEFKINALGQACPAPLLKVQEKWMELQAGDVLIINVDRGCALRSISEWANQEGHSVEIEEMEEGAWDIYVGKTMQEEIA